MRCILKNYNQQAIILFAKVIKIIVIIKFFYHGAS